MPSQNDCSLLDLAMEPLIEIGFEGIVEMIEILMNSAMQIERSCHLRAKSNELTDTRCSFANS